MEAEEAAQQSGVLSALVEALVSVHIHMVVAHTQPYVTTLTEGLMFF